MSLENFIAKRILPNRIQGTKVSRPIINIAVFSISLSIVVNLLTIAIVRGFQNEIYRTVTGFSASLFIQNANNAEFYEADPIHVSKQIEKELQKEESISSYNRVVYKPGLIQGNGENHEVLGLVFKGVDAAYDFTFIHEHLVSGRIPNLSQQTTSDEVLMSQAICNQLKLKLNDEISAFFVKDNPISRKFKIVGIYNTGFEDYDKKLVLCDLRVPQKLNEWGISSSIDLTDSLMQNQLLILLNLQSANTEDYNNLLVNWGNGLGQNRGLLLPTQLQDTTIKVRIFQKNANESLSIVDKHSIRISYEKTIRNDDHIKSPYKEGIDNEGLQYRYYCPVNPQSIKVFNVRIQNGSGTSEQFISGYEIHLKDLKQIASTYKTLKKNLFLIPNEHREIVKLVNIFDMEKDLFNWLSFLDINVYIILVLMIIVGTINMASALLVMIIVRSNFIGMMKAMGSSNSSIIKIFSIQSNYLLLRGLIYGNVLGLAIYFLQKTTGIFSLNPEVYYLDKVPMELNLVQFIVQNVLIFVVCQLVLLLPSLLIAYIKPIKTIKFN